MLAGGWWLLDAQTTVLESVLGPDGSVVTPRHAVVGPGHAGQVTHTVKGQLGQVIVLQKRRAVNTPGRGVPGEVAPHGWA